MKDPIAQLVTVLAFLGLVALMLFKVKSPNMTSTTIGDIISQVIGGDALGAVAGGDLGGEGLDLGGFLDNLPGASGGTVGSSGSSSGSGSSWHYWDASGDDRTYPRWTTEP